VPPFLGPRGDRQGARALISRKDHRVYFVYFNTIFKNISIILLFTILPK
jgi:hypothetical protein